MQKKEKIPPTCKSKIGRPSDYTPSKGKEICVIIATTSLGLSYICEHYDFPHPSTVRRWMLLHDEFRDHYTRAKILQADILAEQCIEIADNSTPESFNVDRLRIDSRKWIASKLLPKQYGDHRLLEQKTEENEMLKEELMTLRAKLDASNKKDF